jgi:hypothetical protein
MGQAFSIQTIFIPILRKNKSQNKYHLYTIITFIAGFCVYMYIAYMGAYGNFHIKIRYFKSYSIYLETINNIIILRKRILATLYLINNILNPFILSISLIFNY